MAGHELHGARKGNAMLTLEHAHHGQAHGHQGGLRILGERELVLGALPHDGGELLTQGFIDFRKDLARGGAALGQGVAHADVLASLARKSECDRHRLAPEGFRFAHGIHHGSLGAVKRGALSSVEGWEFPRNWLLYAAFTVSSPGRSSLNRLEIRTSTSRPSNSR